MPFAFYWRLKSSSVHEHILHIEIVARSVLARVFDGTWRALCYRNIRMGWGQPVELRMMIVGTVVWSQTAMTDAADCTTDNWESVARSRQQEIDKVIQEIRDSFVAFDSGSLGDVTL